MSRRPNDVVEDLVVERLTELTASVARRVDDGSADGLHDHELKLPGGLLVALEITGEVDEAIRAANAATRKYRLTGSGVTALWDVSLVEWTVSRRLLARTLPAILIEFEAAGRTRIAGDDDPRLVELSISSVEQHEANGSPGIYLTRVGPARSIGPIDVLDAVTDHASRLDNLRKLGRAVADERHLAVWIDITSTDAYTALNDMGLLPDEDPAVDDVIDVVWALRVEETDAGLDIDIVWCWRRDHGWSYHGRSRAVLGSEP